jgi:uncharacterized protein (TIGR03437 family)
MSQRLLSRFPFLALAVLVLGATASGQPAVYVGGVVNAASSFPLGSPNYGAAPGSIVSIYGINLFVVSNGVQSLQATTLPLPMQLGGTSVTVGGVAAPLFYASPGQINAQVPYGIPSGPQQVIVSTASGSSSAVSVPIQAVQPGLFSASSTGAGAAAAQNTVVNGSSVTYVLDRLKGFQ